MTSGEGRSFGGSGAAYDAFMGRYSAGLAAPFVDFAGVGEGGPVLDLGCGPGALSQELVGRLGADQVLACDPAPSFVESYARRFPTVDVRVGSAEEIPFEDNSCGATLAQLVLHFVPDPVQLMREVQRVTRPGGTVSPCVWELGKMELVALVRAALASVVPPPPTTAARHRFGTAAGIGDLFRQQGCREVVEGRLHTKVTYAGMDELWSAVEGSTGPQRAQLAALGPGEAAHVRATLLGLLGDPPGPFTLTGVAGVARGRLPS